MTRILANSFSSKIILALVLVVLIPACFTSLSYYLESNSILKKNTRESIVQISKQTADSLSSILNAGINTSDLIASDPNIQRATMHLNNSPSYEESWNYQFINSLLNNLVYSNSFVKIVYVLKEDGRGWGSGTFSEKKLKSVRLSDLEWVKEAKRRDGELVWQGLQYDRFSGGGVNTDLIVPVGRVLKNFDTLDNIGLVQVHLDGRSILGTIDKLKIGKTGKFFVADKKGSIMIDSNLRLINKQVAAPELYENIVGNDRTEFEYSLNGVRYYGVKQLLSNGWLIVGTVPLQEITGQLDRLKTRILISSAVFSVLAICIGLLIARRVVKPVNQLSRDMQRIQQGDMTVRTDVCSSDEIGILSNQFNRMLDQIEQLIHQVQEEQNQKFHAELRAVTHRVHPHFLYNTLNTLGWLIQSNQNDRASQVLSALNHLLVANMGKNGNMITVAEELDIIRKYLVILELRYEKNFHLELDVEPGTEELIIPRMLLQPLVENAIFHGIVPKKMDGRILIRIRLVKGNVEFLVSDDGLGIENRKLKELNDPETAIASGEIGIGLRHLYDTLRLYYPGHSEWSITNGPEKGVTVRILLKNQAPIVS
ncbi:sensor histidine kinase [Bacillus sp. ISL-40]|uniref:cache domain-containing sensor histidine kinase n=1 Tax=unclassified Bacillus (in: firmicutes) TaxID=185979 RepID=UPI001BE5BFD3|nr:MULTISPECIES: sensor histidine kinase [unclassified Bacillus (in: firmicutes)]MBT2696559.1 sensor histidine kinase [Bacillus sp. ISL-40]MBT2740760.1 sensor histidine kinase [Bacillus sp. ISL-77]